MQQVRSSLRHLHCASENPAATLGAAPPSLYLSRSMHSWILAFAAQGPSSPGPGEYDAEMDRKHRPPAYTIGGRPASRYATLNDLLITVCLPRVIKLYNVPAAKHSRALACLGTCFDGSLACKRFLVHHASLWGRVLALQSLGTQSGSRSARLLPGLVNQMSDLQLVSSSRHSEFRAMCPDLVVEPCGPSLRVLCPYCQADVDHESAGRRHRKAESTMQRMMLTGALTSARRHMAAPLHTATGVLWGSG